MNTLLALFTPIESRMPRLEGDAMSSTFTQTFPAGSAQLGILTVARGPAAVPGPAPTPPALWSPPLVSSRSWRSERHTTSGSAQGSLPTPSSSRSSLRLGAEGCTIRVDEWLTVNAAHCRWPCLGTLCRLRRRNPRGGGVHSRRDPPRRTVDSPAAPHLPRPARRRGRRHRIPPHPLGRTVHRSNPPDPGDRRERRRRGRSSGLPSCR